MFRHSIGNVCCGILHANLCAPARHLSPLSFVQAMREGERLRDKRTNELIALAGAVTFMKSEKRFKIATEILADVTMLSEADFFIGQCWSGVSALASSMYMSRTLDEFGAIPNLPISVGVSAATPPTL